MAGQSVLVHAIPGETLEHEILKFCSQITHYPFNSWMILPTRRLVKMVQGKLIDMKKSFLPDHICTLDELCEHLIDQHGQEIVRINSTTSRLLLIDIMHEHEDDLTLFFTNKNPSPRAIQDLQTLLQVIIRREINYPACLGSLASEKSYQIDLLISAYKNRLVEKNLVDPDTLLIWVIDFLSKINQEHATSILGHVHLYGLFEPLPLEKRLITSMKKVCSSLTYTIPFGRDPEVFSDSGSWLSPDFEEDLDIHIEKSQITTIFSYEPSQTGDQLSFSHITGMGFSDPVMEMNSVAREISRLLSLGASYDDIVVVSPDVRTSLGYATETFADFHIPITSSQGPHISTTPLIAYYLTIFDVIEKGFRYEELIRVIQSPYCRFRWTEYGETGNSDISPDKAITDQTGNYRILLYDHVDLICRSYGLDGGHIDWDFRLSEIVRMCKETKEDPSKEQKQNTEEKSKSESSHSYSPRRPLPVEQIEITVNGILRFIALLRTLQEKRTIPEHIDQFNNILREIGSPVPGTDRDAPENAWLSDEEFSLLKSFESVYQELKNISRAGIVSSISSKGPISFIKFIRSFRHLIQDKTLNTEPGIPGIMLTGIREIVHQHYPYVFLISLNEGFIPRLTTRLPFTNASENARMDTRTLSDILRQEKYQFIAALLSGTSHVYLSWYEHKDERTTLPSVFIDHLRTSTLLPEWEYRATNETENPPHPYEYGAIEASIVAGKCIHNKRWREAQSLIPHDVSLFSLFDRITIERSYRFRLNRSEYDGIIGYDHVIRKMLSKKFGTDYHWSASMFETYAKCPFRFYLERVVHIRPLPDIGSDLPPETKGNLIHTILSRFERTMYERNLLPLHEDIIDQALSTIKEIAIEECDKVPYATPLWHAKKRQLMGDDKVGDGMLDRFVFAEIERLQQDDDGRVPHPYKPSLFEFSFGAVKGPDDDPHSLHKPVDLIDIQKDWNQSNGDQIGKKSSDIVRFIGKIDRIDCTPDGLFGIIDYKTGKKIPGPSDLTRMTALQLPLYLLAYHKISHLTPAFGSYVQLQRKIMHSLILYDPAHKRTLPKGKLPKSEPKWRDILECALDSSISHVHTIRDGQFPIQATSECNTDWYCPYKTICRFQPDRGSQLEEWSHYPSEENSDMKKGDA